MPFEFLIRMVDGLSDDELDELRLEKEALRAIEGEDFNEERFWGQHRKFVYMPITMEMTDILPFSKYDKDHSVLCYGTEWSLVAKIRYSHLKAIYTSMTGETIRTESEFRFDKNPPASPTSL